MIPSGVSLVCLFLFAVTFKVEAAPQFGSVSQANAQAGAFGGGGFGPPTPYGGYGPRPGFGPQPGFGGYGHQRPYGYGPPNAYGRGLNGPAPAAGGLSISVSKSVSIGGGGAAAAQSSARSGAAGK